MNASALITGGTGGFGVAIARRLQAAGYAVVLADIDIARGPGVAAALGATFIHCDVASRGSLNAAVAVAERHGPLKTVHLNAGIGSRVTGFDSISDDIYRRVMAVNVDGVWFGIKAALPALRRAGGGHVVVTASLAGLEPWEAEPAYSTAKHAAVALVRSVAPALAAEDIVVNVICPGFADTPLLPRQIRDAGLPLLNTDEVADAAVEASTVGRPGQVYLVLPGHVVIDYQHREIPKPGGSPAD